MYYKALVSKTYTEFLQRNNKKQTSQLKYRKKSTEWRKNTENFKKEMPSYLKRQTYQNKYRPLSRNPKA
jgi:hypothetical protein